MAAKVKSIPDGFHSLTPHLVVSDAAGAIEFYEQAFGAEEIMRAPAPSGDRLMHAEVRIGDSILMMSDTYPEFGGQNPQDLGGSPLAINLYCDDVDAMVDKAVAAGATVSMPPADMFWGDRYARLLDPFGHIWAIACHVRDVTPEEMTAGAAAAFAAEG